MQRLENFNKQIIGHLNINLTRSKAKMIANIISSLSIFVMSEWILDSSFPNLFFHLFHTSKQMVTKFLDMIGTSAVGVFFDMQMNKYQEKF